MEYFLIDLIFPLADALATLALACQIVALLLGGFLLWERVIGERRPNAAINFLGKNSVFLMFIVAFTASMGSLFSSDIAGWPPCKLCWLQRIFMYPQVILLGVALWRKETRILPYALFLCLVGMSISIVHYSEQVLAMIDPIGYDQSVPCDFSGISCRAAYIQVFGYITVPMLALTAFMSNALIAIAAMRHPLNDEERREERGEWGRIVAGIGIVLFLFFLGFTVQNTQGGDGASDALEAPLAEESGNKEQREAPAPVLMPKDRLETIVAQESVHWTFAPAVPLPTTKREQRKIVVEWEATERIGDLDPETGVRYEFLGREEQMLENQQDLEEEENTHVEARAEEVIVRILQGSMIRDDNPNNDYDPKILTVKAGTTILWMNEDRVVHTVTARDRRFNSGNMQKGERWSFTFTEPGEYDYYCIPHPWMTGKIIVEK